MSKDDQILIDATRVHRARLASALSFGSLDQRRTINNNVKRFIGSVVLAAVAGVGCLGFSFVVGMLHGKKETEAISSFRSALAQNPIEPTDNMPLDPDTGFLKNNVTGELIDPKTGFKIDPTNGLVKDPDGNHLDPRLNWYIDLETGYYTDPETGVTIDPATQHVVKENK